MTEWEQQEVTELRRLVREERQKALEDLRERCIEVVRSQPNYPDTHTGMRQQWVRDQIVEKLRALELLRG